MTPLDTPFADRWDLMMALTILAALLWLRSLHAQNARLRAEVSSARSAPRATTESARRFMAIIERDLTTGEWIGSVPGIPGLHAQAGTLEELRVRLQESTRVLDADAVLSATSEFVGVLRVFEVER